MRYLVLVTMSFILGTGSALAGKADVLDVKVERSADGLYRFSVTVRHGDEGWEHYANRWEVLGPGGVVLARRVLLHPHVGEQPFTRSLGRITIPDGVKEVVIRAGDLVHGFGGKEMTVALPGR